MFCPFCATSVDASRKFCCNCGRQLPQLPPVTPPAPSLSPASHLLPMESTHAAAPEPQPSTSSSNNDGVPSFQSYVQMYSEARQEREDDRRGRHRGKSSNKIKEVKIKVGVLRLVCGELKARRGYSKPVAVPVDAGPETVQKKAVEKLLAYGCIEDGSWLLVYPHSYTIVKDIPGSKKPFTVSAYREDIGGAQFDRVSLYLVEAKDYAVKSAGDETKEETKDDAQSEQTEQASESDTDSEVLLGAGSTPSPAASADTVLHEPQSEIPEMRYTSRNRLRLPRPRQQHPQQQNLPPYMVVDLVSDSGEEDVDLQVALAASLEDDRQTPPPLPEEQGTQSNFELSEILERLRDSTFGVDEAQSIPSAQKLLIQRKRLLEHTLLAVAQADFSFNRPLEVKFSGEEADDWGGPRREFFTILMKRVSEMGVFEGRPGHMEFSLRLDLLRQMAYLRAGQFLRWSILQGGPGLPVLKPSIYQMLCQRVAPRELNVLEEVENLADPTPKEILQELLQCEDQRTYQDTIQSHGDWLMGVGVGNIFSQKLENRSTLMIDVLHYWLFVRVQAAMEQFAEGLGEVYNVFRLHTEVMSPLLTDCVEPLSAALLESLYKVQFSEEGSNRRGAEEDTIFSFESFLRFLETSEDCSLEHLLQFWTGADQVPPGGFTMPLVVDFYTEDTRGRLPTSSTCGLQLCLPRGHADPMEFRDIMIFTLKNTIGFGKI